LTQEFNVPLPQVKSDSGGGLKNIFSK